MPVLEPELDLLADSPRSLGVPKSAWERFTDSFTAVRHADHVFSLDNNLDAEYQRIVAEVHSRTGQTIKPRRSFPVPTGGLVGATNPYEQRDKDRASLLEQLRQFQADNPGLLDDLPGTPEAVLEAVSARVQAEEKALALSDAVDPSFGGDVSAFAGAAAGLITDPVMLATLTFGAPARIGLLKGTLQETAIAALTESGIQVPVQLNRAEMGLEAGFDEAAKNVAAATVATPVFYMALRGMGIGLNKLLDSVDRKKLTPEQREAVEELQQLQDALAAAPERRATTESAEAHQRRLDEAMLDLKEGRIANVQGLDPASLSTPVLRAAEVRATLLPVLRDVGADIDEVLPGLTDAIVATSDSMQVVISKSVVDELTERLTRLSGREADITGARIEAETALLSASRDRAEIHDELARISRALDGDAGATRSVLSGDSWQAKLTEALKETGRLSELDNVRGALLRRREKLNNDLKAAETRRADAAKETHRLNDEAAKLEKDQRKAVRRLDERVRQQFTPEQLARLERNARLNPLLSAAEQRNALDAQAHIAEMDRAEINAEEIEKARELNARDALDTIRVLDDEDKALFARVLDEAEEDEAMLFELRKCMKGAVEEVADA